MKIKELVMESYSAYVLNKKSRANLIRSFPPKFSIIDATHITVKFGLSKDDKMPHPAKIEVVGYASDDSLEAVVVSVNGKTQRADGKIYHITLSYEIGRKPVQSNGVIANGWEPINKPFEIDTKPEILK
jgi:hypothetical protein